MRYILVIINAILVTIGHLSRGAPISNQQSSDIGSIDSEGPIPAVDSTHASAATGYPEDVVRSSLVTGSEPVPLQLVRRVETRIQAIEREIKETQEQIDEHQKGWDHWDGMIPKTHEESRMKDLGIRRYGNLLEAEESRMAGLESRLAVLKDTRGVINKNDAERFQKEHQDLEREARVAASDAWREMTGKNRAQ